MRIMPACLYAYTHEADEIEALRIVHVVSGLTHNHLRSLMGCGLYYFCVREVLDGTGTLRERLQNGLKKGFAFYEKDILNRVDLSLYARMKDLSGFGALPEQEIRSSGYVVDSLEAAVWCLVNTDSFAECLLMAVNLGDDTDTIAAIAGGLAGLYYGYDSIPKEWLEVIQKRDWIEGLCRSDLS